MQQHPAHNCSAHMFTPVPVQAPALQLEPTTLRTISLHICSHVQAAINAAFADDGELLFVGSNLGSQQPVFDGEAVQVSSADCAHLCRAALHCFE